MSSPMGTAGPDGVNTSVTSCGATPPSEAADEVSAGVDPDVVLEAVADEASVASVAVVAAASVLELEEVGEAIGLSVDVSLALSVEAGSALDVEAVVESLESVGVMSSPDSPTVNWSKSSRLDKVSVLFPFVLPLEENQIGLRTPVSVSYKNAWLAWLEELVAGAIRSPEHSRIPIVTGSLGLGSYVAQN